MSSTLTLEELSQIQTKLVPQKRTMTPSPTQPTAEPLKPYTGNKAAAPSQEIALAKRPRTALERLEFSVGGRQQLIDVLSAATLDKRQQHFLNLLSDPQREHDTINTIARDSGLKPSLILDLYKAAAFSGTVAEAFAQISDALPEVVRDITEKSVDAKVECPRCFGSQYEAEGVMCSQCNGKGQIMRTSDLDRQKIVLESAGIIKKSQQGVNVQVNQNQQIGVMQPGSFFSRFVKDSDQAAYDIDAEIIEEPKNE